MEDLCVIEIKWKKLECYENGTELMDAVYVMSLRDDSIWYIGRASKFGDRYNGGYNHLIDGFLKLQGRIYVGCIREIQNIESFRGRWGPPTSKEELVEVIEDDLILFNNPPGNDRDSGRRWLQDFGTPSRIYNA
ncbi:MAG: hypothetical protein EOP04_12340, partial [Proteobacteria bacterium]